MNYHIDNILIWDNFREKGECPLRGIYLTIEGKFVSSYLNEAVMEDPAAARSTGMAFAQGILSSSICR